MPVLTALLIAVSVLGNSAGDLLLARAMRRTADGAGRPQGVLRRALRVLGDRDFLLSVLSNGVALCAFAAVLAWADLSFAFPATSLVYVLNALGARHFLGETVTPRRWGGILLVCAGVALVSLP